jgi:tripartite-type tricarboxylate transporter receptor subunit TctC
MQRRTLIHSIIASLGFLAFSAGAQSTYPAKPVRIVVPFGAGGVADLTARTVAAKMSEGLGQPIVIENRPSAGGIVAGDLVAKAEPDGYTLLLMSNGTAVSTNMFKSMPFDAQRDFAPVSILGNFDIAIVSAEGGKFKTLAELMAFAKANPGKLNVGTINIGSTQHLASELFQSATGLDFQVVPFNGTPAVITALRGGSVDVAFEILGPVMGQINGKALRPLAVMGEKRAAKLPEVPTLKEMGIQGAQAASWNALAAPAKTPKEVIARLNKEAVAALNSPDVKAKLLELNVNPHPSTPEQLGALLASETKRWGDIIVKAKIEKQ